MSIRLLTLALSLSTLAAAWLPSTAPSSKNLSAFNSTQTHPLSRRVAAPPSKIRGVNLGSYLLIEPWMVGSSWNTIGCSGAQAEFDCVQRLGQDAANTAFRNHWDTWIPQSELDLMKSYGLNTIRIPVGFWIVEDLVREGESYPKGGLEFLDRFVGWAKDAGMFVILDLHGGPGVQARQQSFTGQVLDEPGFFNSDQFDRAWGFLEFMTSRIVENEAYANVGILEVINEPDRGFGNLVSEYYPEALRRIRSREDSLGVPADQRVHVQFMNTAWGAGDPNQNLPEDDALFYDSHLYFKYEQNVDLQQSDYLAKSCTADVGGDRPVSVGEWSIDVHDDRRDRGDFEVNSDNNLDFYRSYWANQIVNYEKADGWVFWNWKTEQGNDFRWSYKTAVERGVISQSPDGAYDIGGC